MATFRTSFCCSEIFNDIYKVHKNFYIVLVISQDDHLMDRGALFYLITFTFMHLADAFIQSDLHCIQVAYIIIHT